MPVHDILRQRVVQWYQRYFQDEQKISALAEEVVQSYAQPGRYYHNAEHITTLLALTDKYAQYVTHSEVMEFAIFYHDIVYDVLRSDNEERSAEVAQERLQSIGLPTEMIQKVCRYILATKSHDVDTEDKETSLFLDFDLAILAAEASAYDDYARNIRREYAVYEDAIYTSGRISVLQSFLQKPNIYLTELFRERYEAQARKNMEREILSYESNTIH